jgi:hypothetical protein
MKSPNTFQRLLRVRTISFVTALTLHLGWALTLCVLLMALRRSPGTGSPSPSAVSFVPVALLFAAVCAAASAAVWGGRQQVVRWIRGLTRDDLVAALAAVCAGGVALSLIGLVAVGLPSLSARLSRGEMDAVMVGAIAVIGVLAVSLGWVLVEGLVGGTPSLPGRIEASLSRRGSD